VADEISRLTSDLRRHDERVQAMSEAVSTIAHRLGHNDTSCPVCATEFPPGRLVVLARAKLGGRYARRRPPGWNPGTREAGGGTSPA
jgi:hypothetical protein